MLDANDIQVLREMFAEQDVRIDQRLDQKLEEKFDQKLGVFRDELVTEMTAKIHTVLHVELYKVRDDIIDVVNGVLPQIDKLDHRVTRLERWARMA